MNPVDAKEYCRKKYNGHLAPLNSAEMIDLINEKMRETLIQKLGNIRYKNSDI